MNIASVIVAVDLSDHARHAADCAAMLAAKQRAQLELLLVIRGSSLDSFHNWSGAPVDAEIRLREDSERSPHDMIHDIAGKRNVAPRAFVKTGHSLIRFSRRRHRGNPFAVPTMTRTDVVCRRARQRVSRGFRP